jgi:hypothetical protein
MGIAKLCILTVCCARSLIRRESADGLTEFYVVQDALVEFQLTINRHNAH